MAEPFEKIIEDVCLQEREPMKKAESQIPELNQLKAIRRSPIKFPQTRPDGQRSPFLDGNERNDQILLLHMPFWTPMIPPMGISQIKSFLERKGYRVSTADLNIDSTLRHFYQRYFDILRKNVPEEKRGNFYSIGHDVLRNHTMAYVNRDENYPLHELVKIIISRTYFVQVGPDVIAALNAVIKEYFDQLRVVLTHLIEKMRPHVFGLSVFRDTLPSSIFAFQFVRENWPGIKNIMGGPIFSEQLVPGTPDYTFFLQVSEAYIDNIFIGQGEILLHQYLCKQLPASQRVYIGSDLRYAEAESTIVSVADYSDFDLNSYPYLGANASTGCSYECSFCNVAQYFGRFQPRDIGNVVDEMEHLYKTYSIPLFFMTDHMINPVANKLAEEIRRRNLEIYWTAYLRITDSSGRVKNTSRWRDGGMYCARIGIESGSQNVLDLMGKRITPEQSKQTLMSLAAVGIKTTAYFVVGHPGETEEDFQQTLDFLEEMKDFIWEAECDYFNYNYSGQSHSDKWASLRQLVYPEDAREILICQKWSLDCYPSRDEIFERVSRFSSHCQQLGIPNTYNFNDIFSADQRWQKLHNKSVPALLDLRWSEPLR